MTSSMRASLRMWAAPIALACAASSAAAASDTKLLDAATRAQPAVIDTLKGLVQIETGSGDLDGLAKMATLLDDRLKALGFKTERRKTTAGAGADMVVGTLKGTGKRNIMLQAHMDTVYLSGILQTQPYKQDGNKLYGPGIADDKGGLAVILHALAILRDAGWNDYATLTVLVNPDEEVSSVGSGEIISALADQHDTVLSFEPTAAKAVAPGESLLLGAAGIAQVTLEVKGRASHAGGAPELGRNAAMELAHQMLQLVKLANADKGTTINFTIVKSGDRKNVIPDYAVADADIRAVVAWRRQRSPLSAARLHTGLLTAIRTLANNPDRWPLADEPRQTANDQRPTANGPCFRISISLCARAESTR